MTYKASLDGMATAVTVIITVLAAVFMLRPLWEPSLRNSPASFLAGAGLLVIYFFCFGFRPVSYTLTTEGLVIHRVLSNVHIPREDLETVEAFPPGQKRVFRIFAVGGLFGYFGKYGGGGQGLMTWYVTRKDRMVLIELRNEKKIVISPDEGSYSYPVFGDPECAPGTSQHGSCNHPRPSGTLRSGLGGLQASQEIRNKYKVCSRRFVCAR